MRVTSGIKTEMPKLYNSWRGMKDRCRNLNRIDAHCYAAKGVTLCREWQDIRVFKAWSMENGYHEGLTIDRKDSAKGYSPENCQWVDRKVQARNISRNRRICFAGETRCLSDWAERTGISATNILARIDRLGWPVEKALTTPTGAIPPGPKHDHMPR